MMNGTHHKASEQTKGFMRDFAHGSFQEEQTNRPVFVELAPDAKLDEYDALLLRRMQLAQEAIRLDVCIADARHHLTEALQGRTGVPLLTEGAKRTMRLPEVEDNIIVRRKPGRPKGSKTKKAAASSKPDKMHAARAAKAQKQTARETLSALAPRTRKSMRGLLSAMDRLGAPARLPELSAKLKITTEAARQRVIRGLALNLVQRLPDGTYRAV